MAQQFPISIAGENSLIVYFGDKPSAEVAAQIGDGRQSIFGVMLESFLLAGKQKVEAGAELVHGQSITDACMGWETSVKVLEGLAAAVGRRRKGARRA